MGRPDGGKVTIYVDCVSPYSLFGFTNAVHYRPLLKAHGITLDIVPFFLGGARDSVGNPWQPTLKSKEAFSSQDTQMTGRLLGIDIVKPEVFPILSLFAVRVATWVKDHCTSDQFDATFEALGSGYWCKGINISTAEGIVKALDGVFSPAEMESILKSAVTPENKQRVLDQTMGAGAFGAPWIVGVDGDGQRASWWGNDRWDQVFAFLGVPYTPVSIVAPKQARGKL